MGQANGERDRRGTPAAEQAEDAPAADLPLDAEREADAADRPSKTIGQRRTRSE
jgi:hypothetical protein